MKFILFILSCSFCFHDFDSIETIGSFSEPVEHSNFLSPEESEMIYEINRVRANPIEYVDYVLEYRDQVKKDSVLLSNMISETIRTKRTYELDGSITTTTETIENNYYQNKIEAIDELILDLINSPHLPVLTPEEAIYKAAEKHAEKQIYRGYIDHFGTDGTWPFDRMKKEAIWLNDGNENIACGPGDVRDILLQLLIDSGVPERGHRYNILNPNWEFVACYKVEELSNEKVTWWIQEFAK